MIEIRTVLCPVDFTSATPRQVGLATALARTFGARLVLHHNLTSLAPGAGVGWMWNADHPPESPAVVERKLQALLEEVGQQVPVEARMTSGQVSDTVNAMSDSVDADLVVLSTHETSADDHTSITEEVLARGRRSILVLHDTSSEGHVPSFALASGERHVALVPTALAPDSPAPLQVAFDLARRLPLSLHLLHFVQDGGRRATGAAAHHDVEERLRALVPDDLAPSVTCRVEAGDPVTGILRAAAALPAACIVMGEHTRAPLRRWFSRDTSRAVLHQAPCPVWYVPAGRIH